MAEDRVLRRRLEAQGPRMLEHAWRFPGWRSIQPVDDANADALRVRHLQASPRQICAERGIEFEDVAGHTVADNALAIRTAIAEAKSIQAETGVAIDWRDVLFLTQGEPITPISGGAPGSPAGPDNPDGRSQPGDESGGAPPEPAPAPGNPTPGNPGSPGSPGVPMPDRGDDQEDDDE
jgi:hypothetical protein